ncbi:septum site-determining protein MinC [Piscinibacter sakaiensis]|uniref:septum site-determining protein MinC n=1 Tax=Piscinibacter sakaiensis TaxID=1547922 RepID=UPI003AAD329B
MALAPKGSAPPIFDFKSASLSLVALVLKTADLDELRSALQGRLGDTPQFFSHDPVLIDLAAVRDVDTPEIDFSALIELLREHRMNPVAVRGGSAAQHQAAQEAGLVESSAEAVAPESGRPAARPAASREPAREVVREVIKEVPTPVPALVVDRPLRSGQQVYAKGGDLVVLSVVNFGAELIADGSIHVYAPLRGKAIAGARGNVDARIYATCLEAELISIAGTYRTAENPLPAEVRGKPALIRLVDDKLVIEAMKL